MLFLSCYEDLLDTIRFVRKILWYITLLVPIILIAIGTFDMLKAITASKEDEIRTAQKIFVKRIAFSVLVFLIVPIVNLVFGLFGEAGIQSQTSYTTNWIDCWNEAGNDDNNSNNDNNRCYVCSGFMKGDSAIDLYAWGEIPAIGICKEEPNFTTREECLAHNKQYTIKFDCGTQLPESSCGLPNGKKIYTVISTSKEYTLPDWSTLESVEVDEYTHYTFNGWTVRRRGVLLPDTYCSENYTRNNCTKHSFTILEDEGENGISVTFTANWVVHGGIGGKF